MYYFLTIYLSILLLIYICIRLFLKSVVIKQNYFYIKNFESYAIVINYYLEKAYDLIYKDRIAVYSFDGMRPNEDEFNEITKEYCKLVIRMLGSTLTEELIRFCGGEETLFFLFSEYFNAKSINDEIRQSALDSISNQEHGGGGAVGGT